MNRLFVDMDGTLATFHHVDALETLYEKGYFLNLTPHQNVVDAVKQVFQNEPDISVYVLSAVLADSATARDEKNLWLDKHLPEIDEAHRLFTPCGVDKAAYLIANYGIRIDKGDVLLDDYTKNLISWDSIVGRGLKLLNGINDTRGTWNGARIEHSNPSWRIAEVATSMVQGKGLLEIFEIQAMRNRTISDVIAAGGKSSKIWESDPDAICYIPESADTPTEGYSRNDIVRMCHGDDLKAQMVFDLLEWQSPSAVLGEWDIDDEEALANFRAAEEAERICKELNGLTQPNSPNQTHLMVKVSDDYLKFGGNVDQLYDALQRKKLLSAETRKSLALQSMKDMKGLYVTILPEREHVQPARIADQLAAAQEQAGKQQNESDPHTQEVNINESTR